MENENLYFVTLLIIGVIFGVLLGFAIGFHRGIDQPDCYPSYNIRSDVESYKEHCIVWEEAVGGYGIIECDGEWFGVYNAVLRRSEERCLYSLREIYGR